MDTGDFQAAVSRFLKVRHGRAISGILFPLLAHHALASSVIRVPHTARDAAAQRLVGRGLAIQHFWPVSLRFRGFRRGIDPNAIACFREATFESSVQYDWQ
jgi:hypothetical protein